MSSDNRFWGVGPQEIMMPYRVAEMMGARYNSAFGWQTYAQESAHPMGWAWTYCVKNIPSFNPELCQSMANDIATRNSKLVNLQMTDYVSQLVFWCLNPSGIV